MKKLFAKWASFLLLCLLPVWGFAEGDTILINNQELSFLDIKDVSIFIDGKSELTFEEIKDTQSFHTPHHFFPTIGVLDANIWLRFTVTNQTTHSSLLINVANSDLREVVFYFPLDEEEGHYDSRRAGNQLSLSALKYPSQYSIFKAPIRPGFTKTFYLKIKSKGQVVTPIYVGTTENMVNDVNQKMYAFGIYIGVILIMFFYNLFLYFSVKDINYLYYIVYIFVIGFTQFVLKGYGYLYLWDSVPLITRQSVNWVGALSGIAATVFLRKFLRTHEATPKIDILLQGVIIWYLGTLVLTLLGLYNISYVLINFIAFVGSFIVFFTGLVLALRGQREAKFFLVAWSFFLASIILFVMSDFGFIPYNGFSRNVLLIGSSLEVALLSFALADRINTYRKEKDLLQIAALQAAKEKEDYIRKENIVLEEKVKKRTQSLERANTDLSQALQNLKSAQMQLVHAEKMASIGQLTAGVAHEINNPINFIKSNIRPLELDINDLLELVNKYQQINEHNLEAKKEEINAFIEQIDLDLIKEELKMLLAGIKEGSIRTAEIVKGLHTFSRVDEDVFKPADLHKGIDSTLLLISNIISPNLLVKKEYDPTLPLIECNPGKINQVFMNLLTNAIQAMEEIPKEDGEQNMLKIRTQYMGEEAVIHISDTGPGIPTEIQKNIFDPFFTTKDVGKGTGLGLSIVYSIIKEHNGAIEIISGNGKGTEFIITLPVTHSEVTD